MNKNKKPNAALKGNSAKMRTNKKPQNRGKVQEILEGKISGNSKGYAFLVPSRGGEDYFIPANSMKNAMHGDTVKAKIYAGKGSLSGEAEIIEIIQAGSETIVGTYSANEDFGFVMPDDLHYAKDVFVKKNNNGKAQNGDKVVVTLFPDKRGSRPEGKIIEILGKSGDPITDILSIIRSYNLYEKFPPAVLNEAEGAPGKVEAKDIEKRKDFRGDLVITIDGDDSRDFDDAVSVQSMPNGSFKLQVHIADVSHYVRENSKLDTEALKRGTSVYFPTCVLPMLPKNLSNGICSLNEGEDRLVLSCLMEIDTTGNVIKSELCEGVMRSSHRMTYNQVSAILEKDKALEKQYADTVPMLKDMEALAQKLFKKRIKRGAIEFEISESKIIVDEKGVVTDVCRYERKLSHRIIEEFMLAANEAVAERFESLKAPFVYRVHLAPSAEKVEALTDYLSALGISFKTGDNEPRPKDFADMLYGLKPELKTSVNRVALRSMTKASYEKNCDGHFGLAAPFYCHFTSPIRRYPDLMIHRIIKAFLAQGKGAFARFTDKVEDISKLSSQRERLAESAEREVDDLLKAQFMQDKIGERYSGIISGVTEWGIFVELENTVEGLIKVTDLPGDGYVYEPKLMLIKNVANTYRIGEKIDIVVDRVTGDRVGFVLAQESL